jgi:hypothetical protein
MMKHASRAPSDLDNAISLYAKFWSSMDLNSKMFEGREITFDGSLRDLEALFYCVYEVGFPEDDYYNASLIWAQVVVKNTEAQWLEPISGNIAIGGPDVDYPKLIFFPHTRLLEIAEGAYTQFDLFAFLTDHLLFHAALSGYTIHDLPKLYEMSFSQDYSGFSDDRSTFDGMAIEARHLRMQRRKSNRVRIATNTLPLVVDDAT